MIITRLSKRGAQIELHDRKSRFARCAVQLSIIYRTQILARSTSIPLPSKSFEGHKHTHSQVGHT